MFPGDKDNFRHLNNIKQKIILKNLNNLVNPATPNETEVNISEVSDITLEKIKLTFGLNRNSNFEDKKSLRYSDLLKKIEQKEENGKIQIYEYYSTLQTNIYLKVILEQQPTSQNKTQKEKLNYQLKSISLIKLDPTYFD